jgi:hypothetical protein
MHVLTQDGVLWRTLPCPIPPGHRLQGVRLAGPASLPDATATVQRRVSSRGGIQVACQKIQVGMTHAGKIVTVIPDNNTFRLVIDGDTVGVVPRTTVNDQLALGSQARQDGARRNGVARWRRRWDSAGGTRPSTSAVAQAVAHQSAVTPGPGPVRLGLGSCHRTTPRTGECPGAPGRMSGRG